MSTHNFITLSDPAFNKTRDAIHAYARVLGNWLKQCSDRRKHWWHASLRPSLNETDDPHAYLLDLWNKLLVTGRTQMLKLDTGEVQYD